MSIEALKEKEKGIMTMSPQKEDIISINLSQRSGLESSEFKKSSSRDPMKRLAQEGAILIPMAAPFT